MPQFDDSDLERRSRSERSSAREEFVQRVGAQVDRQRPHSQRPRMTFAIALSLALLVSLVAFGGVGAASEALQSSTSAVKSAVGKSAGIRGGGPATQTPAVKKQYHPKVEVCYPRTHVAITYTTITKYKRVWKTVTKDGKKIRVLVKASYLVKVPDKTKVTTYESKKVSEQRVPGLVSRGAVYPLPAGGCSSLGSTSGAASD
jgi:hypothetical protein